MFARSFDAVFIPDHYIEEEIKVKAMKQINQYALIERIGDGWNSKVFLALDTETRSYYAIKATYINGRNNEAMSFQREVRILRQLDHPNIVQLKQVLHSKKKQTAYLVMEWASFGSLQNLIGLLVDEKQIATIFKQVCCGLEYLHGKGIVHHDIKPLNILLFDEGIAKLADFGVGHSLDSTDSVVGTPAYQAPEFMMDDGDVLLDPVKEDIWSLGVSIYQVAFGHLPWMGDNVYEISHAIRNEPLQIPINASANLCDLLKHTLDPNPEDRFTLEEVMNHPFFADVDDVFNVPLEPMVIDSIVGKPMQNISANVCDEDYSFVTNMRVSNSWSGL